MILDQLSDNHGRRGRQPRFEAPAANPAAQPARSIDVQGRWIDALLGPIGERHEDGRAVDAGGARHEGRVLDVDVGEAVGIQAKDEPTIRQAVEPAKEGPPQTLVTNRLPFMPELAIPIDAKPRTPQPV